MSRVAGFRPASTMFRVNPKMRLMARTTGKSRTNVPLPLMRVTHPSRSISWSTLRAVVLLT